MAISTVAAPIATVAGLVGQPSVSDGASVSALSNGARIEQGSTVETDANSRVELVFDDGTMIAIGPNSRLEITDVLMSSSNRASRFAVKAIGGGFRFISGKSDREVYKITTPTATMGIRGTVFDIAIVEGETLMALFDGEVQMCRNANTCKVFADPCSISIAPRRVTVEEIKGVEALEALGSQFYFFQEPPEFGSNFDTDISSCSRHAEVVVESIEEPRAEPAQIEPPAPQPPAPEPPTPPSKDFPGNSGDDSSSEGKGGGVSAGQNGFGTGNGRGGNKGGGNNGGKK